MDYSHMSGAMLIGGLIGIVIAILIGALILSVINRLVNGFWPHYGRSVATIIVAGIISSIINFIIRKIIGIDHYWVVQIIGAIVNILVGGGIMSAFVRRPDGSPLGFKRGALVFLVLAILGLLLAAGMHPWVEHMRASMPTPPAQ